MPSMLLWSLAGFAATVYCLAAALRDFRQRRYVWAVVGLMSALVFLLMPIQTHAIKIDLPVASNVAP